MAVNLTLNNKVFSYPTDGQERGWGEGATDWAVEANVLLNSLFGSGDFVEKTFSSAANVTDEIMAGITFDVNTVTAVDLSYRIRRGDGKAEKGTISAIYKADGPVGDLWTISQESIGDIAGISFKITDQGQLLYTDLVPSYGTIDIKIESQSTLS